MRDWAALHKKELIFFIILFIVASLGFGLGYLAGRDAERAPIIIEKQ